MAKPGYRISTPSLRIGPSSSVTYVASVSVLHCELPLGDPIGISSGDTSEVRILAEVSLQTVKSCVSLRVPNDGRCPTPGTS